MRKARHKKPGWITIKLTLMFIESQCVNVTAPSSPPFLIKLESRNQFRDKLHNMGKSWPQKTCFYYYYRYDPRNSASLSSQAMSSGRGVNIPKCPQSAAYMPQVSDLASARRAGLLQLNLTLQG